MRQKPKKLKNGWKVDFRYEKMRYRKRFSNHQEAIEYIQEITGIVPQAADPKVISSYLEEYHRWSEKIKGKKYSTVVTYRQMLGVFWDFCKLINIVNPADFTEQHMRQFQQYYFDNCPFCTNRHNRNYTDGKSTWNRYREAVSAFWNWGAKFYPKQFLENPATADDLKIKVDQKPPKYLTNSEINTILSYFDSLPKPGIYPAFFRTLLYTGMRLGEVRGLKWDMVNLDENTITLEITKSKHGRIVPISPTLKPWVEAMHIHDDQVYVFGDIDPAYHEKRYWQELRRCTVTMGLRSCRIHDFRHTFTKALLESSVDLPTAQKILGHRDIRTTLRYAQYFCLDSAKDAVASISFVDPSQSSTDSVDNPLTTIDHALTTP